MTIPRSLVHSICSAIFTPIFMEPLKHMKMTIVCSGVHSIFRSSYWSRKPHQQFKLTISSSIITCDGGARSRVFQSWDIENTPNATHGWLNQPFSFQTCSRYQSFQTNCFSWQHEQRFGDVQKTSSGTGSRELYIICSIDVDLINLLSTLASGRYAFSPPTFVI